MKKAFRTTKSYILEGKLIKKGSRIVVESEDYTDTTVPPVESSDASMPDEEDLDMYAIRRLRRLNKIRNAKKADDEVTEDEDEVA